MLQVTNRTPFSTAIAVLPDLEGVDTLYVAVKAAFEIRPERLRVAATHPPVTMADEYWGEPGESSVKYAAEMHPPKPATDVVVVGDAHAPGGKPSPRFGAAFSVGRLKKLVQVHGERVWRVGAVSATPSTSIPVARVPLVWERAFGGRHDLGGGRFLAEMRNPVGVGFRGKRGIPEMNGTRVPNLEDPRHPIDALGASPVPAGVGFVAPAWEPRISFAGTYDDRWRKERAPYFPADFDARFFQAAPPDQIYPGHLAGGEPVELLNLSPAGVQKFKVPICELEVAVWIGGLVERPAMRIETLVLEPDKGRFSLLWKGALRCDKQALRVEQVLVDAKPLRGMKT